MIANQTKLQTLAGACKYQSIKHGSKTAFVFKGQKTSFNQFEQNTNRVANGLLKQEGMSAGTRVAYLATDCPSAYEILFACSKIRAVFLAINWRLAAEEILFILNNSEAETLFVSEAFFPIINQINSELKSVKQIISITGNHSEWISYKEWIDTNETISPNVNIEPDDIVVQMYTSGTTGHPKGVQLTHFTFFKLMQHMKTKGYQWMNLNESDSFLLTLPIFHIGGLWWGVQSFLAGGSGVLIESFIAEDVLELIEKHQISQVIMVPSMVRFLSTEPKTTTTDFTTVKGFLYGGSPMSKNLLQKAMQIFNCDFYQIYGMTETGNMAVCLSAEDHTENWNERMKSAGKALPGVEAKVIDLDGQTLLPNEIGEICLKSPSNMVGYWKNEEATKNTLINNWIHTGDAGYMDEDGYIFICDRIKDMIIYADENIYPAEIEAVLNEHESISEVAVVGIPDERWGEIVKCFIVLEEGASLKKIELINFLRGRIAGFKIPKSFSFVSSLPRNPSGKILKRLLRTTDDGQTVK